MRYPTLQNCACSLCQTFILRMQHAREINVSNDEDMLMMVLTMSLWNQKRRSTHRLTLLVLFFVVQFSLNDDL